MATDFLITETAWLIHDGTFGGKEVSIEITFVFPVPKKSKYM